MNPKEDPRLPIVALKGLPITVVALLRDYAQPATQTHLCDLLNYTDKTMSSALHRLEEFQMLSHSELGWSVTVHIALLGFTLPEWLQAEVETDVPVDTCPVDNPVGKGRKISDSTRLTTSSSTRGFKLTNKKLEKNLLLVLDPELEIEPEPKAEPEPEPEPDVVQKPKSPEKVRECRQAALEAGIGEPKATTIANLPYVTPELIRQHVKAALAEGQRIGLAIHRLENNHTLQKTDEQESSEQEEKDIQGHEDRQKYVKGKYSAWVQH